MNKETKNFILQNIDNDTLTLSLKHKPDQKVDLKLAIQQIEGLQKIRNKVPIFFSNKEILYPKKLSLEQSSSQETAIYKSKLFSGEVLIDLTGGFGIDACFMAESFSKVFYIEQQDELCEIAKHNFKTLGIQNIKVINANSTQYIFDYKLKADWIYLDPARRDSNGNKVVLFSDCQPNVTDIIDRLFEISNNILLKLSPMMDIASAVNELKYCNEVHVVSVENECKELLLVLKSTEKKSNELEIKTINFSKSEIQRFSFTDFEEKSASSMFSLDNLTYLYEPNSSILKAGGFKVISKKFIVNKLHTNSHLYSSTKLCENFPGRTFKIERIWKYNRQEMKELTKRTSKANLSVRNFPLKADELKSKLKIKDGGNIYLFATTLCDDQKVIIECSKI